MATDFEALLRQWGATGFISASCDTGVLNRVGAFEGLETGDLVYTLFGGPSEIAALCRSLEGQLLPRLFRQGEDWALVSVTPAGIVFGVFGRSGLVSAELYRRLHAEVADLARHLERPLPGD